MMLLTPYERTTPLHHIEKGPLTDEEVMNRIERVRQNSQIAGDEGIPFIRGVPPVKSQPNSPLFELPGAVRKKIYSYVPLKEQVNLQLLCRETRKEIRARLGIRVFIDGNTKSGPAFKRDVKMESLCVSKYEYPAYSPLFLISHPTVLRELIFDGPISCHYMDAFLRKGKMIRTLHVFGGIKTQLPSPSKFKPPSGRFEWRSLPSIQSIPPVLIYLQTLSLHLPATYSPDKLTILLRTLECTSALQSLTVVVGTFGESGDPGPFHSALLLFLETRTRPNFYHLAISVAQKKTELGFTDYEYYQNISTAHIVNISQSVQLREMIFTEPSVNFHIWTIFLKFQQNLEIFQVLHLMYWRVHQDIILRNRRTLTRISIHTVLFEKPDRLVMLDMGVFSYCPNLIELYICVGVPRVTGASHLYNFHLLPRSLECLNLRQVSVLTVDLTSVLELPKLKCLGLITQSNTGKYGMTYALYMTLLRKRSLDELLVSRVTADSFSESVDRLIDFDRISVPLQSRVNKKKETLYLGFHDFAYWKFIVPGEFLHSVKGRGVHVS